MPVADRIDAPGPRRLLSLDGGGLRGVVAAEILVRMEEILRARVPGARTLADGFDFVGGTSTGSILAAGVALGIPAAELRDFYLARGPHLFRKTFFTRLWHRYDPTPLARELRSVLGEETALGAERLRTLLLIVSKNVTDGKAWFFTNNPRGKYAATDSSRPLWKLVLASSAAPTYCPPVELPVGPGADGKPRLDEFVDGEMSMFNNPSLQLFLEATNPAFGLGWPRGAKNVLLVSVGTGYRPRTLSSGEASKTTLVGWAGVAIDTLMEDANVQQNLLLRMISRSRKRPTVDAELGDLGAPAPEMMGPGLAEPLLTYHRYTTSLTKERFATLGLPASLDPDSLAPLDAAGRVPDLAALGRAVAAEQVADADFDGFW